MNKKNALLLACMGISVPVAAVLIGRALAARQLQRDVEKLFAAAPAVATGTYRETQLAGLPAPVQRYFRHVLRDGQPYLRGLRLRHTGRFKTDLQKDWVPIEGEQYLTTDPPGFIWQGTTRQFTARDEYVAGRGRLLVRLLGAVPIVQGAGPHYNQGELLRWLGESTWLPTSLLPREHLHWTAVDDHTAQLTFTHAGETVAYRVRFNERDEIAECETQRYQGEATLLPWVGRFGQYQERHGVCVPTWAEASWVVDGQRQPYAQFIVQEFEFEPLEPF